jgi:acyl-CoA reductase-like NAD-dependent aldehyde dehydrogenase
MNATIASSLLPEVQEFLATETHASFVGGKPVHSENGTTFATFDPGSGEKLAEVHDLQPNDVARAVDVANEAFRNQPWARLATNERAALLHRLADEVEKRKAIIGQIESLDAGKLLSQAENDVQNFADTLRYFTDLAQHVQHRTTLAVKGHEAPSPLRSSITPSSSTSIKKSMASP